MRDGFRCSLQRDAVNNVTGLNVQMDVGHCGNEGCVASLG
jgi:hypothetical protein